MFIKYSLDIIDNIVLLMII